MGRPRGSTKPDLRVPIQVRLSPDERLELEMAASREGLPLSSWLRWLGIREAKLTAKQGQ
jgi:hypothetical protein